MIMMLYIHSYVFKHIYITLCKLIYQYIITTWQTLLGKEILFISAVQRPDKLYKMAG